MLVLSSYRRRNHVKSNFNFVMIKNVNFVCVRGEDQQKMSSQ